MEMRTEYFEDLEPCKLGMFQTANQIPTYLDRPQTDGFITKADPFR